MRKNKETDNQLIPAACTVAGLTIGFVVGLAVFANRCMDLENKNAELKADYYTLSRDYSSLRIEYEQASDELNLFINPIEYGCVAAPLYDIDLSEELQQYTYDMCRYYNIEEHYETVLAIMWQESNFVDNIISSTDDYGLMQINACNHQYLREELGINDILNAKENIHSGIYIFKTLLDKCGNTDKALMSYNMGYGTASKLWAKGTYSSSYSRKVLEKEQILRNEKNI